MHKLYLLLVLILGSAFIGCLGDEVGDEVKPQIILQPPYVRFQAQGTSDLIAKWGPSLTDTQANFKGYYLELYRSVIVDSTSDLDSVAELLATAHAPKSDTFYVFKNITPDRYTIKVWGERYSDSLVISKFPSYYSFTFDPAPVLAPNGLMAHSNGSGNVSIYWEPSPSLLQPGMAGYIVRYRDSVSSNSKIFTHARPSNSPAPIILSIQFPLTSDANELPYKIWVKGVRNDSTESADSAVIVWGGVQALGINQPAIGIGKKFFIGKTNVLYELKQSDAAEAQIGVTAADSVVTVEAFAGAKFAQRIDIHPLDSVFFGAPLAESDFTEASLTLPRNPATNVCFYVLFAEGTRARVMFVREGVSGTLIHNNNSIRVEAKFQTKGAYNLSYF